jgi:hypothetical protein
MERLAALGRACTWLHSADLFCPKPLLAAGSEPIAVVSNFAPERTATVVRGPRTTRSAAE